MKNVWVWYGYNRLRMASSGVLVSHAECLKIKLSIFRAVTEVTICIQLLH